MATGDIARAAAAAPLPKKEGQPVNVAPTPAPAVNAAPKASDPDPNGTDAPAPGPVSAFGRIIFAHPTKNEPVYGTGNERRSKTLLSALVEIGNSGIFLRAKLKAVQQPTEREARLEFAFFGTQHQNAIVLGDADGIDVKAAMINWKRDAVKLGKAFLKANPTTVIAAEEEVMEGVSLV